MAAVSILLLGHKLRREEILIKCKQGARLQMSGLLTDTTVAGRYISVIMVKTLTAAPSCMLFSVRLRMIRFS